MKFRRFSSKGLLKNNVNVRMIRKKNERGVSDQIPSNTSSLNALKNN